MLSVGGAISLIMGSIMLFETEDEFTASEPYMVLVPTLHYHRLFSAPWPIVAGRAQFRKGATGQEGLLGETAVVVDPGRVRSWASCGTPGASVIWGRVKRLKL
jgi:membrane-bound serine protease (ClpP class)